MPKSKIVINCDLRETRVALIEGGVIAELQIERAANRSTVGNIVLGKVTRVLPGMQAAFIDVGLDRAAFLHVEDLIRPDDFEAYLYGGGRDDHSAVPRGDGGRRNVLRTGLEAPEEDDDGDDDEDDDDAPVAHDHAHDDGHDDDDDAPLVSSAADDDDDDAADDDEPAEAELADEHAPDDAHAVTAEPPIADEPAVADHEEAPLVRRRRVVSRPAPAEDAPVDDESQADAVPAESTDAHAGDDDGAPDASADEPTTDDGDGTDGTPTAEVALADDDADDEGDDDTEPTEPAGNEGAAAAESLGSRRRRRRRRRGRGEPAQAAPAKVIAPKVVAPKVVAPPPKQDSRDRGHKKKDRKGGARPEQRPQVPARVSRSVPITEVVREGDEVIVQISKEPIGTKGARVTSHVSLPGRYVVYLPTVDHVGISKRIGSAKERSRLREVVDACKPPKGGLIVRTVAEGLTKKALKNDIAYLVKSWSEVSHKREGARAPTPLYTDLDLVLKIARDLFTDECERIVIDDKEQYKRLVRFVEMFLPHRVKDIELYQGQEPVFDAYGIEDEIGRALSRKVPLPSGGYLIIDQAEALTAIDVNTGRYVGKGSKDLEETALKTNLEACDEIAYQLRFRNIGGLVILDLIDMDHAANRERVYRHLEQLLGRDKAKTTINRISDLGLIEMTRKRTRESLMRMLHEPCFYCDGTGQIMSRTTIAYEILRQIRRERATLPGYSVLVNAHPAIVDIMQGEEREAVAEAERRYMRRIELAPRREYHIEQFDLVGR